MTPASKARTAVSQLVEALCEGDGEELDPRHGVRSGGIPESLKEAGGESLSVIISGNEYLRFRQALNALRSNRETEHLAEKELDSLLWELTCRVALQPKKFRTPKTRVAAAQQLLDAAMKPWSAYEIATDIENLDLRTMRRLQAVDATFIRWTPVQSAEWNVGRREGASNFEKHAVAVVTVEAGDQRSALARAAIKTEEALQVLRYALVNSLMIALPDDDFLFRAGSHRLIRPRGSEKTAYEWRRNRRPAPLEVETNGYAGALALLEPLNDLVSRSQVDARLKRKLVLAARWLGKSVFRESYDDKIVDLCTALEALLTSRDDRLKGEAIAVRSLMLPLAMGQGFSDPYHTYVLYERRSDIVHGTGADLCSEEDYRYLRSAATRILSEVIALLNAEPSVKSFSAMLSIIETPESLKSAIEWFRRYGKYGKPMVKFADERLAKPSPAHR